MKTSPIKVKYKINAGKYQSVHVVDGVGQIGSQLFFPITIEEAL